MRHQQVDKGQIVPFGGIVSADDSRSVALAEQGGPQGPGEIYQLVIPIAPPGLGIG
ncbi:Uncharacterised protein [Mycobacteroides abscessus subsp. abscessus]|nr:Uncharacterised protein [Mycobacteroides abscessus subsp. abscessus]